MGIMHNGVATGCAHGPVRGTDAGHRVPVLGTTIVAGIRGQRPRPQGVADRVDRRPAGAAPYGPATRPDDVITITRTGRVRRMYTLHRAVLTSGFAFRIMQVIINNK